MPVFRCLSRAGRLSALALGLSLVIAGSASGSESIVGGNAIQVQSAPWTVFVRNTGSTEYDDCSGSILDPQHVLTAAHCVFDGSGTLATPAQLSVRAGISNFSAPLSTDAEQDRTVSSFTVHPGYTYSTTPGPDDVAVIALGTPLDLTGPAVRAVALPSPGAALPSGAAVGLAGFGQEASGAPANGQLNWLTGAIDGQGTCGANYGVADDAVRFCASSPTSSACEGDSGGGLVTTGSTPTLVGVLSAGTGDCGPGSQTVYTDVAAPEILMFVQGDQQPPTAPRETSSTFVNITWDAPLEVGTSLKCSTGDWSGQPTSYAYAFVDGSTGAVLQHGPSPLFLAPKADIGDTVECTAQSINAGGTAAITTTASPPIGAAAAVTTTPASTASPTAQSTTPSSSTTSTTASEWNAETIAKKANAIPIPSLGARVGVQVPQWDGYLRLALLGNQNPYGPRYQDTYVDCSSASSWPHATGTAPSSNVFVSTTGALGFYRSGSPWIDVPIQTCVNAAKAARGALDPTTVIALGSVLHETFNRQGIRSQATATCLGAIGVWQAVDRRVGPAPANHAFSLLLQWYGSHVRGGAAAELHTCASRLHVNWNG
jgi:hypothetical protein